MKLVPLGDRVVLKQLVAEETTKSGIDVYKRQGIDYSHKEWRRIAESCLGQKYIAQEYCRPYKTENINFGIKPYEFQLYSNLTGLYTYNGKFQGVYSRMSDGGIISTQYNEKTVATRYIDEEVQ